jgi:hypothetical protein
MLSTKITMERRTSVIPITAAQKKNHARVCQERIVPETLVAAGRHANNRAMCHTLMLEAVPVV